MTNEDMFILIFGRKKLDEFRYYLTHVLTNTNVTEKFENWLKEEFKNERTD